MDEKKSKKKQKVLLMGKSGSGKSSMRSIIFSNYVAKDTRRLGATIDVEHSHVRFLGNLTLNLWDCGGQDAFVENYLSSQAHHVFSNVGVLIYVFDIESREFDRDLVTFGAIVRALAERSPLASVFCLIHKMDLVQDHLREKIYKERVATVKDRSGNMALTCFQTSIWDQSLYKAWSRIIYSLIPNIRIIEEHLQKLVKMMGAEEIVLFERTTFLVVANVADEVGDQNPLRDRFERLSNIIKTFRQSLAKHTGLPRTSPQFIEFAVKSPKFGFFIAKFTANTYISVAVPPGEATFNCAVINTKLAIQHFEELEGLGREGGGEAGAGGDAKGGNDDKTIDESESDDRKDKSKGLATASKKEDGSTAQLSEGVKAMSVKDNH
ncbi:MAG: GTP-binding protein gtr1 [Watsoniomyces obsoletus]|nr:MAG: GTP-binding protein gtr1 [Watsoniomyces obsoletus]